MRRTWRTCCGGFSVIANWRALNSADNTQWAPYVLYFYCHEAQLADELDGGQHAQPQQERHDQERTRYLKEQGIRLLRFWNHEALKNMEGVLKQILDSLSQRERE